jgi:glycosyltransferase involved in cell wall biosynthesis
MSSALRFRLDSDTFRKNQDVNLDFENSICKCTLNQTTSTPGLRLRKPIELTKGDYELIVTAKASKSETFFLWVFDSESNTRIGGTLHVGVDKEKLALGFSLLQNTQIEIGVLAHNHDIGDFCEIEFVEVQQQKIFDRSVKPLTLEPNQSAVLSNNSDYWEVTANQDRSTPGCRYSVSVKPNTLHAINVDIEVISVTAAAFLWAYSRSEDRELLPRVHVFSGGPDAIRTKRTIYIEIPENVTEILIGVLFSSAGLKESDSFKLHSLNIEEITTLADVADAGYVLSLDDEEEKFTYCQHVLSREGFNPQRMIAIRGADEPYNSNYNEYYNSPYNSEDLRLGRKAIQSIGAWGYLLTMRKILLDAIEKGFNSIAVFDDDIILTHDFTLKFSRFINNVPDGWDILMLGASQWNWTGVKLDDKLGWYRPNEVTNGSFAMIYHSSIFEKLIESINKMDSPFDSKPLKTIICNEVAQSSYVAWPNIIVADVEKEGIRDSRSQSAYASRFRWRMQNFPHNYKRWRSKTILLHEETPRQWPIKNRPNLVLGVTTINRWKYLEQFLDSWLRTRNNSFNWTIVVADDGSTDETIEKFIDLEIPNTKVVLLQNSGGGIAIQTNSIFNYVMGLKIKPNLIFSADDDIFFKQRGWDTAYFDAVQKTGFDHLVHFNPNWKPAIHEEHLIKNEVELSSLTDGISCMGCFYTVTPELLTKIGGFDQIAFPIRGHSHIDFTMRACRSGYNNLNSLYDIKDATEFLGIHPKEGYISTLRKYSFTEQMILADPKDKSRRWDLVKKDSRMFVELSIYQMLQPESYHLENAELRSVSSVTNQHDQESRNNRDMYAKLHDIPEDSIYDPFEKWSMKGNDLIMRYKEMTVWWKMPDGFSFEKTHPDLFKLAEFVLLSPFEPDILSDWVPSRKPGIRPGLAFSAGCDSTAAMELLPEQTVLMYHKREGFESKLNHSNALHFIEHLEKNHHRPVCITPSNHEILRTINGKQVGFVTDYACAVHAILLADYFNLDSIATGMPLENSYLWHGQKFRDFPNSWFWKKHAPIFDSVGLPILQPVMGCSEIINQKIVENSNFGNFAQSCLRSDAGNTCGECWKCFRKNSLKGRKITITKEIDTFLKQKKLKMAASTIYSIQKMKSQNRFFQEIMNSYPHLQELVEENVQFLEKYYSPALELIPIKYRDYVKSRLEYFGLQFDDSSTLEHFQLYE